jgi:hypothetical protein
MEFNIAAMRNAKEASRADSPLPTRLVNANLLEQQ